MREDFGSLRCVTVFSYQRVKRHGKTLRSIVLLILSELYNYINIRRSAITSE